MGRHSEPRPTRPGGTLQSLQNAALPVALILVVGAIALASPMLRGGAGEAVDGSLSSAETSSVPQPSPQAGAGVGPRKNLAFRAEIVPATVFVKKPKPRIPRSFVRVPQSALLPTQFTVSSYNILGHGHTVPGGNRPGWADGRTRMGWATSLLRAHHVSVAGLQEFQAPQFQTFQRLAGGEYGVYPGLSLGSAAVQNSIVWRYADWELVDAGTTPIPYFDGNRVPMPHVLLRNQHTGQEVWFANYHNPADAHGPAQAARNLATSIQVALFNRLAADGTPVVVTGDMNEREEYLCRVGAAAGMHSADGGYVDATGCHQPPRMNVDWLFGTSAVTFSDFVADESGLASRISDHPMIRAAAALPPAYRPRGCLTKPGRPDAVYCPRR